MKNMLEKMSRQLSTFARKQDLKEIEHMLDLISPIREEFVTKDELEDELRIRKIKSSA